VFSGLRSRGASAKMPFEFPILPQTRRQRMHIGLLGSGKMSQRIGLLFAEFGCQIVMWNHVLRDSVFHNLQQESIYWKVDFERIKKNITLTDKLSDLLDSYIIIESIIEDMSIKSKLFKELSSIVDSNVIITSDTSSLSIEALSKSVYRPQRFHGLHFFNPPHKVRFVELATSSQTTQETLNTTMKLLEQFSMSYVVVPDIPGFVVNNILFSMINAAIHLMENAGLEPKLIDDALKGAMHYPAGPLELADFVGLDVIYKGMEGVYRRTGERHYEPTATLKRLVANKDLGRKTGKGFYTHQTSQQTD
jgi:3-hydroxybutyryl-CoA dehydrogenase